MVRSTFISVGSPFAPYQVNFAELEANHSGMSSRVVSRDIHGAVTLSKAESSVALLQSMQDSVEKLTKLAPYVFPLAQGKFDKTVFGFKIFRHVSLHRRQTLY